MYLLDISLSNMGSQRNILRFWIKQQGNEDVAHNVDAILHIIYVFDNV